MLISIVIPVYNVEKYLSKCIESVLSQTYQDIEIILVNDGSTDNSLKICKDYQKKDSRIRVINQENKGQVAARRIGIQEARGTLIGFVDSDDWIEEDFYESMMHVYSERECDLISTGMVCDYEKSKKSDVLLDNYEEGYYCNLSKEIYPTMLHDDEKNSFGLYCTLCNKLYKKELLQKIILDINEKVFYGEDALILYTYCLQAKSIYILKKAFYHYNMRGDSISSFTGLRLLENEYFLFNEMEKLFNSYPDKYVLIRQLRKYFLISIISHNLKFLYGYNVASLGKWEFRYDDNLLNSKVIIYGAGGCGQALYQYFIKQGKKNNIVSWMDKNAKRQSDECMHCIEYPSELKNKLYDYIIIAVQDEILANVIRQELVEEYQVNPSVIVWEESIHNPLFGDVHYI